MVTDPGVLRLPGGIVVPVEEMTWRFSASGGAGGQHVNTSNTRAEVRFDAARSPSLPPAARELILRRLGPVVAVVASDSRSQARNRDLALERLGGRLGAALHIDPPRRATRPTRSSQRRRLDAKRRQGDRKRQRRSGGTDDDR
ncbi:MAG TPA: alternative ribosome rescue aminoacyl-tRNA hydrolase ArfB [Acidimicrobiales bacterium]|jgi:ribosome-associated protein|nr:alternative ribosome rescue aminoacyl-tRNA hydrolase ArfB [Acidimicrobiales bacterium]